LSCAAARASLRRRPLTTENFTAFRWETRESNNFLPASHHPYNYAHSNPILYTDPSGKCLGYLWGDPNCQFAGTDYTQYDYAGAGQVVVTGLGVAATVVACAGTAGAVCAAGAAGAAGMSSWGNQALDNAGQPVGQAVTHVDWGRVAVDTTVGAVTGPIGNGTGRLVGPLTGRIASAAVRATVQGSIVGATSSGASRFLTNLGGRLFGNSTTSLIDGVLESCIFGAAIGGLTGRLDYVVRSRPRATAGGQEFCRLCQEAAPAIAETRGLPTDFSPGKPGLFNPMYRKYGPNSPQHFAVLNPDGTVTDTTILRNIAETLTGENTAAAVPSHLRRFLGKDTFTPKMYDYLLDEFYQVWRIRNP
jgi:hypothetical protein